MTSYFTHIKKGVVPQKHFHAVLLNGFPNWTNKYNARLLSTNFPTLANFFLAHYEKRFMQDNFECKPLMYLRYVDDIFCVFKYRRNIHEFLNFLNNIHPTPGAKQSSNRNNWLYTKVKLKDKQRGQTGKYIIWKPGKIISNKL